AAAPRQEGAVEAEGQGVDGSPGGLEAKDPPLRVPQLDLVGCRPGRPGEKATKPREGRPHQPRYLRPGRPREVYLLNHQELHPALGGGRGAPGRGGVGVRGGEAAGGGARRQLLARGGAPGGGAAPAEGGEKLPAGTEGQGADGAAQPAEGA